MITQKTNRVSCEYFNTNEYFKGKKICIPDFQREYEWKPDYAAKMLSDISRMLEEDEEEYEEDEMYFSDIIVFHENNEVNMADGQQRIITLAVLRRCINEFADDNDIYSGVDDLIIEYEDEDSNEKWIEFNTQKIRTPYKDMYWHLKDFVDKNGKKIQRLIDIIENKIFFYIKTANSADDAYELFEQLNTGGKPLTKDDIIITKLERYSREYGIKLHVANKQLIKVLKSYHRFVEAYKTNKFDNFAVISFINTYIGRNKTAFEEFNNFIEMTKKVSATPIYTIAELLNREPLKDLLFAYEATGIDLTTHRKELEQVVFPVFLASAVASVNSSNPGGSRLKKLFNTVVSEVKSKNKTNKVVKDIIDCVNKNKDIFIVSLSDFADALRGQGKEQICKALLLMDILLNNTSGGFNPKLITLEHIYPQKPGNDWFTSRWPLDEAEQGEYCHDIGNYLILNGSINKKIKNAYITDKRPEYEKIFAKDKVLETRCNKIDYDAFEKEGKSYIEKRRKKIARDIFETFPKGNLFIDDDEIYATTETTKEAS